MWLNTSFYFTLVSLAQHAQADSPFELFTPTASQSCVCLGLFKPPRCYISNKRSSVLDPVYVFVVFCLCWHSIAFTLIDIDIFRIEPHIATPQ